DYRLDVQGGQTVRIFRGSYGGPLTVTADGVLTVTADGVGVPGDQRKADRLEHFTIKAGNHTANVIHLRALTRPDFAALGTVVVKVDPQDLVVRDSGWTPTGSEVIDGQPTLDFTKDDILLKIIEVTPPTPGGSGGGSTSLPGPASKTGSPSTTGSPS